MLVMNFHFRVILVLCALGGGGVTTDESKNRSETPKNEISKKRLIMKVLSRLVVEGAGTANPAIDKFVDEQFDQLLKSPKLHELVERVSYAEDISRDKALRSVLERLATQADEVIKKSSKKLAANLELILR